MTLTDQILADGLRDQLQVSGESVTVAGQTVAALVNRQPSQFEMMDPGYLALEPIILEVLKGVAGSNELAVVDGNPIPLDLRGTVPAVLSTCVIDSVSRRVDTVENGGAFWLITTIKTT